MNINRTAQLQYCVVFWSYTISLTVNRSPDWVLSDWAHFTVPTFICVYVCVFSIYFLILRMCCIIVTQWDGPCGIEA